jgi:hypothetical protein
VHDANGVTLALIALGAFHGINPAMGWLFATALGLQQKSAWGVVRAIPPIVLGHALSVAAVILVAGALAVVIPFHTLRIIAALSLFCFAGYKIATRWRHPTWVGMQVGPWDLVLWSFLMASAHGAGLMLLPIVLHAQPATAATAVFALSVHTVALFGTMTFVALVAYWIVGVEPLRRFWFNLDFIWGAALIVAGIVTLVA